MENCLVTKLKGSVDNNTLPYLGKGIIDVNLQNSVSGCVIYAPTGSSTILTIVGTGTISDTHGNSSSTSIRIFSGESFSLSAGTYKVLYDKYYAVPSMDRKVGVTFYTEDLIYSEIPNRVATLYGGSSLRGDIKNLLKFTYLTALYLNNNGNLDQIYGDIANLPGTALTTLNLVNCFSLTGNIATLAKYTSLASANLIRCKGIEGSIEGLVAAYRENGVTTKSTAMTIGLNSTTPVTFNGSRVQSEGQFNLTWTASTITFDGVTIDA